MIGDLILSRCYVRNSLKNTPMGAVFSLRNTMSSVNTAGFRITRVQIDGARFEPGSIQLTVDGRSLPPAGGSAVEIPYGAVINVLIPGATIPLGRQTVTIGLAGQGFGEIVGTISDTVG